MGVQDLLAKFYDIENVVTIEITMGDGNWQNVKGCNPALGWRADASESDLLQYHHYNWYPTDSVSISGTKYPTQKQPFSGVAIVKKSFAGSESKTKPSLKLDFSHLSKKEKEKASTTVNDNATKTKKAILDLIGIDSLTLNNSKQDDSYVRQPVGYGIFRQGGIPYARCNFAKVIINGQNLGIYVNLEPMKEPYMQRNFNNNDKGNLYETEWRFDLETKNLLPSKGFNQEGFSDYDNQKDLAVATSLLDKGLSSAKQVIDVEQVTRVLAMQAIVKHWDGYPNNTFVYNDQVAVKDPKVENVKLKLIPSGIDGIYYPDKQLEVKNEGVLSQLIFNDRDAKARLKAVLQDCGKVFDTSLKENLALVDKMVALLKASGVEQSDGFVRGDRKSVV